METPKIVDTVDVHSPYKLALTDATAQIIKNALWILGIEAPEKNVEMLNLLHILQPLQ